MGYDNAKRFRFTVVLDCILPDEDGVSRRRQKGDTVTGPHYKQLLHTGYLQREAPPEAKPERESESKPDREPESKPEREPADPPKGDDEVANDPVNESQDPEPPVDPPKVWTRDDLEVINKTDLQVMFPDAKGTKTKMIDFILEQQRGE